MDCHRIVGLAFGAFLLGSTTLSTAQTAASGNRALAEINTFVAPDRPDPAATPAPAQKLSLVFPLNFAKRAQLDALIRAQQDPASPFFHHWLTQAQIGQAFGASEADIQAIVRYARNQGFTVTNIWPNHLFVSANATIAQAEKAFHIRIRGYNRPQSKVQFAESSTYFAPDRRPVVPSDVAARISSIHGLTNYLVPHHHLRRARNLATGAGSIHPDETQFDNAASHGAPLAPHFTSPLGPPDLSKVYNVDGLHGLGDNGQGMKIAIMSPTQFYPDDVKTFAAKFNITGYTLNETWVPTDTRVGNTNGADEAALDCEVIVGQANKASLTLYETDWSTALIDAWNQAAVDDFPVVSCSWGYDEVELKTSTALVASLDVVLATMSATGQSIFVATGDSGAVDHTGALGVGYPASSPSVTAVGGTQDLTDNNGFWLSESGWSGSTGGISVLETLPKWQTGVGVNNTYSNGMRQVPDVSALSSPESPGYLIYTHSGSTVGWLQVGGTSASTPLWASAFLLMDQDSGNVARGIGNIAPYVYTLNATSVHPAFHDITVGSNATTATAGKYPCTVNWDFVTGWGSADFTRLYAALGGNRPIAVSRLTLNPATVIGGTSTTATVTLSGPAPKRGFTVNLSSSNPTIVSMPVTVTLGENTTTATFTVNTNFLQSDTTVTIMATGNNTSASAKLTVQAGPQKIALSSLTFYSPSVIGGVSTLGSVTLTRPAPKGGFSVFLSADSASVSIPKSLTIPAGRLVGTFTAKTTTVKTATDVHVSGASKSGGAAEVKATLTILPAVALTKITVNPATVTGGTGATGTVTLSGIAPSGGVKVDLTHTNGSVVIMHTAMIVPAGQSSATFPIVTAKVTSKTTSTITGTLDATSKQLTLTVTP